jgi:hypothetical protein
MPKLRPLQKLTGKKYAPKALPKLADAASKIVPDEQAISVRVGLRKRQAALMSENKFAAIKGHRSVIDVAKIKRDNAARKQARLLSEVANKLKDLGDTIRDQHAKRKAAKILSEE